MNDGIVFISVFNLGCIEIAENHLMSLIKSGITNYMAYVTDKESFTILTAKGYKVTHYIDFEVKDKMDFGTDKFNSISYIRYKIINELLKKGKIVWYLDADTVVLANLNELAPELARHFELVMQNDVNMPCTGCMMFFPNKNMIDLTEWMYNNRNVSENDQILFFKLIKQNQVRINLHLLDHHIFPNGLLYFNELHTDPRFAELHIDFRNSRKPVYFVHANWMVGIDKKIEALKSKKLWFGGCTPTPPLGVSTPTPPLVEKPLGVSTPTPPLGVSTPTPPLVESTPTPPLVETAPKRFRVFH